MTPGAVRPEVVAERTAWIREMLHGARSLPLADRGRFDSDPRNAAAAESFLRRALEAILDLGRHVLAKGFGRAPAEYKEIAQQLVEEGVLSADAGALLRDMAGYRNRMVHFYDRVDSAELFEICRDRLTDVESVLSELLAWIHDQAGERLPPDGVAG